MTIRIVVAGYYNNSNLGDNLFVDAFKFLFPDISFIFTNHITINSLQNVDGVFIGGGSLLGEPLSISPDAIELLKTKKIFYIGVGSETNFHSTHIPFIKLAKLIAPRNDINLQKLKELNDNCLVIPDLVRCLSPKISDKKIDKSILIMPNIVVVPKHNDPHWKHAAWEYFKSEFSQTLDELVPDYTLAFFNMCTNYQLNDGNAAIEIINKMTRIKKFEFYQASNLIDATNIISQYSMVITQRFHGVILSQMAKVPCLTIHHHDKLKYGDFQLSYYGLFKNQLLEKINLIKTKKVNEILPIDPDIFETLKFKVNQLL